MERFGKALKFAFAAGLIYASLSVSSAKAEAPCKGPLDWDDSLYETDCCSGVAIPGSTVCFGDTWDTCYHRCAAQA